MPAHPRPVGLVLLLGCVLLLPLLFPAGMFLDGIIYAGLALNLSKGIGGFWQLTLTPTFLHTFNEHPPLGIWIQSLFFRVLGDHYLVEKLYGLVLVVLTAAAIRALWREIRWPVTEFRDFWWVPILLWVLIPKWAWAYRHNVLEITLTLFCLLAVWLQLRAFNADSRARAVVFGLLAAAATVAAVLVKGPVALFVLAGPLVGLLLVPDSARVRLKPLVAGFGLGLAAAGLALALYPPANTALAAHFQEQVLATLYGARTPDDFSRLDWIPEIATKALVPLAAVGITAWICRNKAAAAFDRASMRHALGFLLIALSASLPLIASPRVSGHYLVPSLPFFALAGGVWMTAILVRAYGGRADAFRAAPGKWYRAGLAIGLVVVTGWSLLQIGEVRRNNDYHHDLALISRAVAPEPVIGIDPEMYEDWYLHAIAHRHFGLALDPDFRRRHYLLADRGLDRPDPAGYRPEPLPTVRWELLRRDHQ